MSAPVRYAWYSIVLFTENKYHMMLFREILQFYQMCYIKHEADKLDYRNDIEPIEEIETNKEHIHCVLYIPNRTTEDALLKKLNFQGYFYKRDDGTLTTTCNYTESILKPILTKGVEVRPIHSIGAYMEYLTHEDIASRMFGKKLYKASDVKLSESCPKDFYRKYRAETKIKATTTEYFLSLLGMAQNCDSMDDFVFSVMTSGDDNLIDYFVKNNMVVKNYIIHNRFDRNRTADNLAELTEIFKTKFMMEFTDL